MTDINSVCLTGRLTRDSELKYTASGTAVCSFSLAVNSSKKVGDKWEDVPNYFDVALWGKLGETLSTKLLKGVSITLQGELRQESWEKDGQKRSAVKINANNLRINNFHADKKAENKTEQEEQPDFFKDDIPF